MFYSPEHILVPGPCASSRLPFATALITEHLLCFTQKCSGCAVQQSDGDDGTVQGQWVSDRISEDLVSK